MGTGREERAKAPHLLPEGTCGTLRGGRGRRWRRAPWAGSHVSDTLVSVCAASRTALGGSGGFVGVTAAAESSGRRRQPVRVPGRPRERRSACSLPARRAAPPRPGTWPRALATPTRPQGSPSDTPTAPRPRTRSPARPPATRRPPPAARAAAERGARARPPWSGRGKAGGLGGGGRTM